MSEDSSKRDPATQDAQRDFEQRALRNVRGLVDTIEADERGRRRTQKWALGILAVAVVGIGAVVLVAVNRKPDVARDIVITPASKAPAR